MNLLYVDTWGQLFAAQSANAFYLTIRPLHYVAALLAVVAGAVLAVLAGQFVRRMPRLPQYPLRIAFLASLPIVLNRIRTSTQAAVAELPQYVLPVLRAFGKPGIVLVALVVAVLVVRFAVPLSRAYRVVLLVFFPFVMYTLVRAPWMLATTDFAQFREAPPTTRAGTASASRVVIVLLDELDYENLYLARPKDLALPNFDALRLTAVSFDSVVTPGANTLESVTSLFLQRRVDRVEPTGTRSFVAHLSDGGTLHSDTAKSALTQPGVMGTRIGIIGFALPYCRLSLAAMSEQCDWMPVGNAVWPSGDGEGLWNAVARQVQSLNPYDYRRIHIRRLERMMDKSVQFASDSSLSLVFLHLALPHKPYIWDRSTSEFRDDITSPDGYFDNLVLADRFLGRIRGEMIRSGTWSASTVVVMSDHAERDKLWEKRSTDRRVPLFVKLPGMETGMRVAEPVTSLLVTSLLPDLLAGRVRDATDLRSRALDYARAHPALLLSPK
ncbi:MAG: hypothetical protein ABIT20_07885 [Gemmatimonadaceae bacterium]